MRASGLTDFLVYGVVVAGILVLTRPKSQGPALVANLGRSAIGFVQGISGQTVTTLK